MMAAVYTFAALLPMAAPNNSEISSEADYVNIAAFGVTRQVHANGRLEEIPTVNDAGSESAVHVHAHDALQIEWVEPRNVSEVVLKGPVLPDSDKIKVQYWYRIWPDNGSGGWQRLDDPFNGEWVTVHGDVSTSEGMVRISFSPLSKSENPKIEREGFEYRHTYKIRLLFDAAATVSAVECYNRETTWKQADIRLEWNPNAREKAEWKGRAAVRNGKLLETTEEEAGTLRVKVEYAHNDNRLSTDRGHVIFRTTGWNSFSVFVDDIVREGGIYVRDPDAFVSDASKELRYADWQRPEGSWDATVMEKIAQMPEQSLERVMKAIPAKPPVEAHLGVPNMRQEFTIDPHGDIQLLQKSLRGPGPDLDRRPWNVYAIHYAISSGDKPVFSEGGGRQVTRRLAKGYLPIIISEWTTDGIAYTQSSYATMLLEAIGENEDSRRGHEPLVLLNKIELHNTSGKEAAAHFWIELSLKRPMSITRDGLLLMEAPTDGVTRDGLTPVRGWFDINSKGELDYVPDFVPAAPGSPDPDFKDSTAPRPVLHYKVNLAAGEKHSVYLNVPYIELLDSRELKALQMADYDSRYNALIEYWENWIGRSMQYEVPEPVLNNLFKANLWHTLITTDRDPETGLYEHGAATMHYHVYANETAMVAESLEMRGEHEEALRMLEPFLVSQGAKPLPGNFKSQEGLLYAAYSDPEKDTYTAQGYNMHHGWALWKLCEHYLWTRDSQWLESVAEQFIAACDWITRERQATKVYNSDGKRPVEWGLAPAGDLEDVEEYLYWYATNAYYYAGLRAAADVLAEIGHPEAQRLDKDAEDYRTDIYASIMEATATAPVVKLKDGTWVPYVPPRTQVLTHLKEGWIREGLYPALHLLEANILEPHSAPITRLLQDLEDNIFLSKESGYGVEDQLANFFDLGGFNLQPNLLPNFTAHLRRDEIPHAIRVFYNMFWASFYPDTVCFAEWVRRYGQGAGPLYKTPDECKFVQYMRNMLFYEESNQLRIGMGVPRAWMENGKVIRIRDAATFFGQFYMTITSYASEGRIAACIGLPQRNPAASVVLRLRHPEGKRMTKITLNGRQWTKFHPERELITLPEKEAQVQVVAYY